MDFFQTRVFLRGFVAHGFFILVAEGGEQGQFPISGIPVREFSLILWVMKCLFALASLIVATTAAHASFDLMLLPDTNGGVTRYDPVNRVRLGNFASGNPTAWHSVNLTNTSGEVFLTGNANYRFDYNTGTMLSSTNFPVGITTSNIDGSRFIEAFGTTCYTYNSTLTTINVFSPVGPTLLSGLSLATDRQCVMVIDASANVVLRVRNDVSTALTSTTLGTSAALVNPGAMTLMSTTAASATLRYAYFSGGNLTVQGVVVNLNTPGVTGTVNTTLSGYSNTGAVSIMRAHDGYWVVGRDSTTPSLTRITGVSAVGTVYTTYTTSDVSVPTSRWVGANVVAPEPGTMAALGIGVAALLRRRKA